MSFKSLLIYFFVGGFLMASIMYFGSQGKGYWAAVLSVMPLWTFFPLYTLYYHSGIESVLGYAQGLILITVSWLLYISCIIWFVPYWGLIISTLVGFSAYIVCALLINWLRKL
ncbi:MAG: hypothetical protein ABII23_00355 [bacterium]